jgi:SLT domain-containing protein
MPYTMSADENGKVQAIRTALTNAKVLMDDAAAQIDAARSNADALMAIEKAAGRWDAYDAAFLAKAEFVRLSGEILGKKGEVLVAHAHMSRDLGAMFTDGPAFILAAPGR